MGVLATASLLAFCLLIVDSKKVESSLDQESTQSQARPNYIVKTDAARPYSVNEKPVEDNAAHSAKVSYTQYEPPLIYDYSVPKMLRFNPTDGIGSSTSLDHLFSKYDNNVAEPKSESGYYQSDNYSPNYKYENDDDFEDEEQFMKNNEGYTHYKTTSNVAYEGPHQIETIETKSYHKEVPKFDTGSFKAHDHHGKHKEVHYHQHKHMHKHEHKQEHVHQHKQDHKHDHHHGHKHGHEHKQEHKHDHHHGHKHGHEHKQEHKHDHHEKHKHGHDHHQDHKHDHHHGHKHGHKHDHHQEHKHDHHHGHKHENGHKHDHHHDHKQDHHHGHKHDHHHGHKHDHHQEHKHDHHHGHKHGHHHGHKHDHHHGHKHAHKHSKH